MSSGIGCMVQMLADGTIHSMTTEDTPGIRWIIPSIEELIIELEAGGPAPNGWSEMMGGTWSCEKAPPQSFEDDVWKCTGLDTEWLARQTPR